MHGPRLVVHDDDDDDQRPDDERDFLSHVLGGRSARGAGVRPDRAAGGRSARGSCRPAAATWYRPARPRRGRAVPPVARPGREARGVLRPGARGPGRADDDEEAAGAAPARSAVPPRPIVPGERRYRDGDRVRHAAFGEGTVVTSKLTRDDEEVTVAFPDQGHQALLASLANLEIVG